MLRQEVGTSRRGLEAAIFDTRAVAAGKFSKCDVFCREQSRLSNFSFSLSFTQ